MIVSFQHILYILLLFLAYNLSSIIFILFVALCIASILRPIFLIFQSMQINKALSALFSIVILICFLYIIILLYIPIFASEIITLFHHIENSKLISPINFHEYLANHNIQASLLIEKFSYLLMQEFHDISKYILHALSEQGLNLVRNFSKTLISFTLSFYILKDWDKIKNYIYQMKDNKYMYVLYLTFNQLDNYIKQWMTGQFLIIVIMIIYYNTAFYFINLPHNYFIGTIAGIASLIPYIGLSSVVILTSIIILNSSLIGLNIVIIYMIFFFGNLIENNFLIPNILGAKIDMNPILLLIYIMSFAYLFGIVGMLLCLPASLIINTFVKTYFQYIVQNTEK